MGNSAETGREYLGNRLRALSRHKAARKRAKAVRRRHQNKVKSWPKELRPRARRGSEAVGKGATKVDLKLLQSHIKQC